MKKHSNSPIIAELENQLPMKGDSERSAKWGAAFCAGSRRK